MTTFLPRDDEVILVDRPIKLLTLDDLIPVFQKAREKYGNLKIALCDDGTEVLCDSVWYSPESGQGTNEHMPETIVIS